MRLLTALIAVLFLGSFVFAAGEPLKVERSNFSEAFMPYGFDSNDNIQLTFDGWFPNSCYMPGPTGWRLDKNNTIVIDANAYVRDGLCLQMLIPRQQVLDIGMLGAGDYNVKSETGTEYGKLRVKDARTNNEDDYLYAPVSQAYYKWDGKQNVVMISGRFANSCMSLGDVLVDVQPNVVVIQPIAKVLDVPHCKDGSFPFEKSIVVKGLKKGRYLLHVRSLNGKAVNNIVEVDNE